MCNTTKKKYSIVSIENFKAVISWLSHTEDQLSTGIISLPQTASQALYTQNDPDIH